MPINQRSRSISRQSAPVRLVMFIGLLSVLWLPLYGLISAVVSNSNTASILSMAFLFLEFGGLVYWWNRVMHQCDRPWQRYGLFWTLENGRVFVMGLSLGASCLGALFGTQALLGWVRWQPWATINPARLLGIGLEGMLVAIGVALAEEIVFRGWLLDELERDYHPTAALWTDSLLFAALHFIRPWSEIIRTFPQFPGLVLMGVLLVWAKRSRRNHLGISIGLHAGLVWGYYMINVGDLVQDQSVVSEWWSGVDQNPLAGVLGLGFLAILALWFRQRAIVANRARGSP